MKQMPVESFFFALGRPIFAAMRRTSVLRSSPTGNSVAQLRLVQAVQEVALVLAGSRPFSSSKRLAGHPFSFAHARVVAGGDLLGAQAHRVVEEGLELDLGVAQHVGVGRAAGLVFAQELGEHAVLVLGGEVDRSISMPSTSATLAASTKSSRVEQYSSSSSSSQFFMKRPTTS
jgi:hypothetical protein